MTVWHFIAWRLSLSAYHRLTITFKCWKGCITPNHAHSHQTLYSLLSEFLNTPFNSQCRKWDLLLFADNIGPDQPAQICRLIYVVRLRILCCPLTESVGTLLICRQIPRSDCTDVQCWSGPSLFSYGIRALFPCCASYYRGHCKAEWTVWSGPMLFACPSSLLTFF